MSTDGTTDNSENSWDLNLFPKIKIWALPLPPATWPHPQPRQLFSKSSVIPEPECCSYMLGSGSPISLYVGKEKAQGWLAYSDFCSWAVAQSTSFCGSGPREQRDFLNRVLKKEVVLFCSDNSSCASRIISFVYSTSISWGPRLSARIVRPSAPSSFTRLLGH